MAFMGVSQILHILSNLIAPKPHRRYVNISVSTYTCGCILLNPIALKSHDIYWNISVSTYICDNILFILTVPKSHDLYRFLHILVAIPLINLIDPKLRNL